MLSLPSPCALMSGPLTALLLLLLSSLPPHEATTSASATTAITTRAASRALRLIGSFFIGTPPLGCADDTGVLASPDERHRTVVQRFGILEARACILAHDHQLAASVERDDEARDGTCIQAVADGSRRPAFVIAGLHRSFGDQDALRADRDDHVCAGTNAVAGGRRDPVLRAELEPSD